MNSDFNEIKISDKLDSVIAGSMGKIRKQRRREKINHALMGAGGTIFVLALAFIVCMNNITFAKKLPLVGHIFEKIDGITPKGIGKDTVSLLSDEEIEAFEKNELEEGNYVKTSSGITVVISEIAYDKEAVYMGVTLKSKEAFNPGLDAKNLGLYYTKEETGIDYSNVDTTLSVYGTVNLKDESGKILEDYRMEGEHAEIVHKLCGDDFIESAGYFHFMSGKFIDEHTFVGIIPIEFSDARPEEMPNKGTLELEIEGFGGTDYLHKTSKYPSVTWDDRFVEVYLDGPWNFEIPVENDGADHQVVIVNEKNKDGEGIRSVSKTAYTISLNLYLPGSYNGKNYCEFVLDADGKELERSGGAYRINGHDCSKITVYIADEYSHKRADAVGWDRYADWYHDYFLGKVDDLASVLQENSLYWKEIVFDK